MRAGLSRVVVSAALLAGVACAGDGGAATQPEAPGGSGNVREIRLSGVSFSPRDVTIGVGTTVRWVVNDGIHTVTPDNAGQAGAWTGTGELGPGQTFTHTFAQAGTYTYHCIPHRSQGMTGTIRVQ
jgi:plastocyanin